MAFEKYIFSDPYWGWLLNGILYTIIITTLTTLFSVILGTIVSGLRTAKTPLFRTGAFIYINIFRNLPPVPLLLFLVFGLPGLYLSATGNIFPAGMEFYLLIIGLSLNSSAYIAEILRSGILAVPADHYDGAKVLGLGPVTTRLTVIYPQALLIAFPALGTRLIHNMKNSSIALVLPLQVDKMELLGQAGRIAGQTFAWAEPLIFAAVIYFVLSLTISITVNRFAIKFRNKLRLSDEL